MTQILRGSLDTIIQFESSEVESLYLSAIRLMPVSIAAQFLFLIPVFGVGGAYLFLGEHLTLVQGLGMAITIGAISQISRLRSGYE